MALTDAAGAVIGGLLSNGPVAAPDLTQLFNTIDSAGANQRDLINALPVALQQQYQAYKAAQATAAGTLQTSVDQNNAALMDQTKANFDPNSPAVKAAEDAAKTAIYANVPGQQAAIREALAATGGFGRGTAAKQLAAPVLQAGQAVAANVASTQASQLQQQQQAVQTAIEKINSVDDQTANTLFGMSKDQALTILNSGRQDLQNQLADLINQSVNQTNQTLGVQGANVSNQYTNAVANNAKQNNDINGWVNLGVNAVAPAVGFLDGLGTGTSSIGNGNTTNSNYTDENQIAHSL